jgi:hypothetical protein
MRHSSIHSRASSLPRQQPITREQARSHDSSLSLASKLAPTTTLDHSRASSLSRQYPIIREQARSHDSSLSFASKLAPTTAAYHSRASSLPQQERVLWERACSRSSCSTLAAGFVEDLLHRREKILQHGARAEVDLGVDLHAGRQSIAFPLRLHERLAQFDQRAESRRR